MRKGLSLYVQKEVFTFLSQIQAFIVPVIFCNLYAVVWVCGKDGHHALSCGACAAG
jgi:hypothetical protein